MEDINSRETLEAWLKDKPPTWAAAIALRCALRVLPIALNPLLFQKTYDQPRFVSVLFRALAIAAGTGAYPRADAVNVAAIVAANAAVHTAAKAVYFTTNVHDHVYGADAVNAAIDATDATNAANATVDFTVAITAATAASTNAANAAATYFSAIWNMVKLDCKRMIGDSVSSPTRLLSEPLWYGHPPEWIASQLRYTPLTFAHWGDGSTLWLDWYDRRLAGRATLFALPRAADIEITRRLFTQVDDWWTREPALVNAEIQGWLDELTPPADPEPQSGYGLTFRPNADGVFEDDQTAGSDDLLETPEACDRHGQLADTLREAARLSANHNQAGSLAPRLDKWAELLGEHPRNMRLGRVLQHAELTLTLIGALVAEMRGDATLAQLPDRSRTLVALLEALPDAHWSMVNFDPALARRVPLKNDPDVPQYPQISIGVVSIHIERSVVAGVLTASSGSHIMEMSEGLSATAPESRRERRFWETVKNFPRALLATLWEHKGKVGSFSTGLVASAKFLVTHEVWVQSLFVDSPAMLRLIGQLIDWLNTLPFL